MKKSQGISLVELLVGVLVMGVLLALAAPSFNELLNRRRVQAVADELVSDIAFARAESGLRPQPLNIRFESGDTQTCYTMYYVGGGGNCKCASRAATSPCTPTMKEFKTVRVQTGTGVSLSASTEIFNFQGPQLTAGQANFSVTVSSDRGSKPTLNVQVNQMGRAKLCTPNGTMTGVPACL